MSSEIPQNPDWTLQEERLQYGAEKKKQRDTARLIWASKPRKEPSPKDLEFQTAEIVVPNKATGDLRSFFEAEKKEIDAQPSRAPGITCCCRRTSLKKWKEADCKV